MEDRPTVDAVCPHCKEPVDAYRFCEECGNDLWLRRRSTSDALTAPCGCPGCGAAPDAEGAYCPSCGLRSADGTESVEIDLGALAGVSDRGHLHPRNEDAMAIGLLAAPAPRADVAAVVCDGVSTVHSPELASRTAADAALAVLLGPPGDGDDAEQRVRDAVGAAASAVGRLPGARDRDAPSCTLVCALVRHADGDLPEITVGWVGDSRAYWLAGPDTVDASAPLTTDHSWAVEMVALGALDAATALADPRAHAITRWIGEGGSRVPDVATVRPAGHGALLLCSDGLWNYLPAGDELAELALPEIERAGPVGAATALTTVALEAGGHDNITVVVVPLGTAAGSSVAPHTEPRSPS
jgi:PPM family protein phosphatase